MEEMLSPQIEHVSDHSWNGAGPLSRAEIEFLVIVVQIGDECNRIQAECPYGHRNMNSPGKWESNKTVARVRPDPSST